jgi:hypothetical protein
MQEVIKQFCSDGFANLSGTIGGGASSASWSSSGDGTFGNANSTSTTYTPGANGQDKWKCNINIDD